MSSKSYFYLFRLEIVMVNMIKKKTPKLNINLPRGIALAYKFMHFRILPNLRSEPKLKAEQSGQ